MISTLNETNARREFAYVGALCGMKQTGMVRLLADVKAPSTGEVRPQAAAVRNDRLADGITAHVCVRTWSPPV